MIKPIFREDLAMPTDEEHPAHKPLQDTASWDLQRWSAAITNNFSYVQKPSFREWSC